MLDLRFQRLHGKTTLTTRHHVGSLFSVLFIPKKKPATSVCFIHPVVSSAVTNSSSTQ